MGHCQCPPVIYNAATSRLGRKGWWFVTIACEELGQNVRGPPPVDDLAGQWETVGTPVAHNSPPVTCWKENTRTSQRHFQKTLSKDDQRKDLGRSQTWGLMHKFSTQNFQVWAGLGCSSRFPPNGWRIVLSSGYAALHIRVLKIWPVVDLSAGRCAGTRWMRLPGSTAEKSVIKAGRCQGAVWEMQWWEMQWYIPHIN